ncbi:MAG: hypothetical protein AAFN79_08455 [Pseudomonadota bacterium]
MRRLARTLFAAAFALFIFGGLDQGRTHPSHATGVVAVIWAHADQSAAPDGETLVELYLVNHDYDAATLLSLTLSDHGPLRLEAARDFILFKLWREAPPTTVGPAEERLLSPPDHRLLIPTALWLRDDFAMRAFFDPIGAVEVHRFGRN